MPGASRGGATIPGRAGSWAESRGSPGAAAAGGNAGAARRVPRRQPRQLARHSGAVGATGTAFVAHSGLAGHGLLKWLCEMNDTVFVARHDRTSVQAQVAHVRAALSDTGALAIFPEGTTSDGTGMLPFKSSLLSAIDPVPPGIVVQPVWIDYGPEAAAIAWVGDEHGVDNFLKILARRRPIPVTLHFLPVLTEAETASRKTIAAQARARIAAAMAR
jgi:1-acyl-sn-glycerol-3-phosphate acyltransferase